MDNFFSTMSLGQVRDVNNREVFKNHELCAEFLRDYTDLDLLKNITADDIEDVTEKYHAIQRQPINKILVTAGI